MMLWTVFLSTIVLQVHSRPPTQAPSPESSCPKRCPNLWEPVCGSDGRTYSNKCQLDLVVGCWGEKVVMKSNEKCPECAPGVTVVSCVVDPCTTSTCPSYPEAECRPNYCGGCNAVFYGNNDKVIDCNEKTKDSSSSASDTPMRDLPPLASNNFAGPANGAANGRTAPAGIPGSRDAGAPGTPGIRPGEMPVPPKPSKTEDGKWLGNGQAPAVPLTDSKVSVAGTLRADVPPHILPPSSCLVVSLRDVSIMDVASYKLASQKTDVEGNDVSVGIEYLLFSMKPEKFHLWRSYSISAVINVGWCPEDDSTEWIRKGDYLTTWQYNVPLTETKDHYKINATLECYECQSRVAPAPAGPPAPVGQPGPAKPPGSCETVVSSMDVIPGSFIPQCDLVGFYATLQCHSSVGECWCVDSVSGEEKSGTRGSVRDGQTVRCPDDGDDGFKANLDGGDGDDDDDFKIKLGDDKITLKGAVKPDSSSWNNIPTNSCMTVQFEDISVQDKSSFTIAEMQVPVSAEDIKKGLSYTLKSRKPLSDQYWRELSVSVVVNVGWCKKKGGDEWIRKGDYHSAAVHKVDLNDNDEEYDVPVTVECYSCEKKEPTVVPPPPGKTVECMVVCPAHYQPTCGSDGKTYSNKCLLGAAVTCDNKPGLRVVSEGPCHSPKNGPCAIKLANVQPGLLGASTPSCKEDGSYKDKQCHASSGHCWCVDSKGEEIKGTKKGPGEGEPNCACFSELANVKPGLVGAFTPSCKDDGTYDEKQCHGSTGHCWCVNEDGKEIEGSRIRGPDPNCGVRPPMPGVCDLKLADTKPVPGAFVPTCKDDGTYEDKQCHGSTGHCWCVDSKGEEIKGTKKGPGAGEPNCACARQRADVDPLLLGAFIPSCKDDGAYEDQQCHAGHCWCADENGKEIAGTKKAPGQGEPNCGPCAIKLASVKPGLLGAPTPSCKDDGTYEDKQCHGSTGHCWCVDAKGEEIQGTRKAPGTGEPNCDPCTQPMETGMCKAYFEKFYYDTISKSCKTFGYGGCNGNANKFDSMAACVKKCGPCAIKLANVQPGLLGAPTPSCKDDGSYEDKQCHGSTGHCWCVDAKGEEIQGTRKGPGAGEPNCACMRARANVDPMLMGAFTPSCKDDGTYEDKQCHGSTGHCWCVDAKGKEIDNTRKGPGAGEPNCGCVRARANVNPMLLGAYTPTCKDDGTYEDKQCHGSTGDCWCVDANGKEIDGSRKLRGAEEPNCGK